MVKPTVSTVLWMMFAWMLSMPVMAEEVKKSPAPLVEMSLSPSRIDWHSADPAVKVQRWVLILAGPDELFFRREFKAGKAPFLNLFDSEGDRLPDGSYTWELKAVSQGSADPRRESGSFSIQGGSFVETPQGTGGDTPKPPLVSTTAEDSIETGNLIVQKNTCIGDKCSTTDANFSALKLKAVQPNILFDDIALPEGPVSSHDWALFINYNDVDQFSIVDFSNARFPFSIAAGAPDNSLFVAADGKIGVGTSSPTEQIHIVENTANTKTRILVENTSTGVDALSNLRLQSDSVIADFKAHGSGRTLARFGQTLAGWAELSTLSGNGLAVGTGVDKPLILGTNDTNRLHITGAGNIGIGTTSPSNHLQVSGSAGTNKVLIDETNGTTTAREILELRNNGGPVLIFEDTSVPQRWTNGSLGANFFIDEQAHTGIEFVLTPTGNLTISGVLTQGSSRDLKTDFVSLDPRDVLAKVNALPVSMWRYKLDDPAVRHVGPMAEDFHQAFGLGTDDKHIAPADQAGVALVAVQGLTRIVEEKSQEIEALRRKNKALEDRITALEALISNLKLQE